MSDTNGARRTDGTSIKSLLESGSVHVNGSPLKDDSKSDSPRSSSGWDGKLRVEKKATLANSEALSDPEYSDEDAPPVDQIEADEGVRYGELDSSRELTLAFPGLLDDLPDDADNQITAVEIPSNIAPGLQELELYDNLISHMKGFYDFSELVNLDLSYNKLKHIKRIDHLKKLKQLYLVQNKISRIECLEGLNSLTYLELAGNRIRIIEGLKTLTKLEQLWLGKNKITELKGLDTLANLRLLSVQSNRLTSLTGLSALTKLEDLYISDNILTSLSGISSLPNLKLLDVSSNPIEHLSDLENLTHLQELWASSCQLSSFDEVEKQLGDKKELETVYFEGNPLQKRQPVLYRNKVRLALPLIRQVDASESPTSTPPPLPRDSPPKRSAEAEPPPELTSQEVRIEAPDRKHVEVNAHQRTHAMPREVEPSLNESDFLRQALRENIRLDGRAFDAFRPVEIEFGDEYGVVDVRLGKTRVVARISAEVTAPFPDRKFDGIFSISTELSPMASPAFEVGR
ncbi:3'-5'-exoribonuclease, partial [Cryomyces antarcticus]